MRKEPIATARNVRSPADKPRKEIDLSRVSDGTDGSGLDDLQADIDNELSQATAALRAAERKKAARNQMQKQLATEAAKQNVNTADGGRSPKRAQEDTSRPMAEARAETQASRKKTKPSAEATVTQAGAEQDVESKQDAVEENKRKRKDRASQETVDQRQAMHERAKHDHLQQERMAKIQEKSTAGRDRDRPPKRKQVANSATSGNWEARSCDSFVETGPLPSVPGLDVSMITVGTFGYEKKPACCKALNLELAGGLQEMEGVMTLLEWLKGTQNPVTADKIMCSNVVPIWGIVKVGVKAFKYVVPRFAYSLWDFLSETTATNRARSSADPGILRKFGLEIAQTAAYLNSQSLVHGDLKPDNIMICGPDHDLVVFIDPGSLRTVVPVSPLWAAATPAYGIVAATDDFAGLAPFTDALCVAVIVLEIAMSPITNTFFKEKDWKTTSGHEDKLKASITTRLTKSWTYLERSDDAAKAFLDKFLPSFHYQFTTKPGPVANVYNQLIKAAEALQNFNAT